MKEDQVIQQLNDALVWVEGAVSAQWLDNGTPGKGLLPRLEARRHLALMAEDYGDDELVSSLLAAPFESPLPWHALDGGILTEAAKLAVRRTRRTAALARSLAQDTPPADGETLSAIMQEARDHSLPLIASWLAAEGLEDQHRDKLAGLFGYAHGALAWGYDAVDKAQCGELFDALVKLAEAYPENSEVANGLTFALLPLMPADTEDPVATGAARQRIIVFDRMFDRLSGTQDETWQVNSTGCLASVARLMPEDERLSMAMKASQRVLDWTTRSWADQNVGYAFYHTVEALLMTRELAETQVEERLAAVLDRYRELAPAKLRTDTIPYLLQLSLRMNATGPSHDILAAELREQLSLAEDVQTIQSFVPDLATAGDHWGAEHVGRFWQAVRTAPALVRGFWLVGLAQHPPELLPVPIAEVHLGNLSLIRPQKANEPWAQDWAGALNAMIITLLANGAHLTAREKIDALAADPSCPATAWLDGAGLALVGAGREAPDWLDRMVERVEAIADKDPLSDPLRTKLSFFFAGAIAEKAYFDSDGQSHLARLLERLTTPDADREGKSS